MDVREPTSIGGTESPQYPSNAPHLNGQRPSSPPHHRRHIRYASPEASNPTVAQINRIINSSISPSNTQRSLRAMSASPPPRSANASSSHSHQPNGATPILVSEGQDHDRMETDEESEGSERSDLEVEEEDTPQAEPQAEGSGNAPSTEGEAMDITPDNPASEQDTPNNTATLSVQSNDQSTPLHLVHVQIPQGTVDGALPVETPVEVVGLVDAPTPDSHAREAAIRAIEQQMAEHANTNGTTREERPDPQVEAEGEGEGDDDSDDSTDEEEHPYWTNLKEDTSSPDERELKVIEDTIDETNAFDHEYWEKIAYEPLDDPEYVPGEAGRISWTVKGVHGTAEKPNREKIMRSPSVLIGGFYWNIKYYPHGNDGTEQISIYLECSPTPYEENQAKEDKSPATDEPQKLNESNSTSNSHDSSNGSPPEASTVPEAMVDDPSVPDDAKETPEIVSQPSHTIPKNEKPWGVAAQISCVIYNPDEPRVNAHQKGCHRFYNDNPDWGWTRFHGPWDEIHKRRRFQRQALLRNDTLAFTAYVRTVVDDTKALWWHPGKDKPEWDSVTMTGFRAFSNPSSQGNVMIAALSAWLHLGPVVDLVRQMQIPDSGMEPKTRIRPTFKTLQQILCQDENILNTRGIDITNLINILDFHGAFVDGDDVHDDDDAVMVWETLRRVLNFEASDVADLPLVNAIDLFGDILQLKQPDFLNNNTASVTRYSPPQQTRSTFVPLVREPQSVQEVIRTAAAGDHTNCFRIWESFAGQQQNHPYSPSVLQIELHRQAFAKEARKWKKLTHRIEVNEDIMFNGYQYTLYGMIVHSGDLESKDFYSVIRPEGPRTRWLKYAGDSNSKGVSILTTKQAIEAHEGSGENAEGTAAVAYIVMYVRSDKLPDVLRTPFKFRESEVNIGGVGGSEDPPEAMAIVSDQANDQSNIKDGKDIQIHIYRSDLFHGYSGRGFFDPWSYQAQSAQEPQALELAFPASTTIQELRECLEDKISSSTKSTVTEIRVWPISTTPRHERPYPLLLSSREYHDSWSLGGLADSAYCGFRFWMAPRSICTAKNLEKHESWPPYHPSEHVHQIPEAPIQDTPTLPVVADDASPRTHDDPTSPAPIPPSDDRQNSDTDMAEATTAPDTQTAEEPRNQEPRSPKDVYIFVKEFDLEKQELRGVGSGIFMQDAKIVEAVKQILQVGSQETWDVYQERKPHYLTARDQVKSHETFEHKYAEDGSIYIAQRRISTTQISLLESKGECSNPGELFRAFRGHNDPSFLRDHFTSSYFGRHYKSFAMKNARPHGLGTIITLSGDAYTGSFVAGAKSGQGKMDYANGDTYNGEWKSNEPNGQGQMVYAKTGNTYTGGFKKRKRHGKGRMDFEVADEELQLCKICFEVEMDALFYDCGHVVACDECARQVDSCPVCRRNVRAVVKIWRT